MKLKDAVFHPGIVGYGVSDSGLRFGGGDESGEHGLCYPRGEPLTLRQAVELKADIGDDADVVAFFDGRRDPEHVELPELPIPPHDERGRWTKGAQITSGDDLRRGHLLICESCVWYGQAKYRNLVEIVTLPGQYGRAFHATFNARFVEPADPNQLRAGANADGFSIWPHQFDSGEYFRALPCYQGAGIAFGEIKENAAAV